MVVKANAIIRTASLVALLLPPAAHAYRPFDSTHPEVADIGKIDIEFGPVTYRREPNVHTWIAPQVVFNYGLAERWELVLEGQREHETGARWAITDTALSFKHVLREGSLQDKPGLSIAAEAGVLLPQIRADHGAGATLAGIIGQSGPWGAFSLTLELERTRDRRFAQAAGLILEGPAKRGWRPVAELTYAHEAGSADIGGALLGLIWEYRDGLEFDLGVKRSYQRHGHATEFRIGVTLGI